MHETRQKMLEFCYHALSCQYGIAIRVTSMTYGINMLHSVRAKSGDPALKPLSFRRAPDAPDTDIWITHNAEKSGKAD